MIDPVAKEILLSKICSKLTDDIYNQYVYIENDIISAMIAFHIKKNKELSLKHPNDAELGKVIRKLK